MKLSTVVEASNLALKHYENGTMDLETANKITALFWSEYKAQEENK